MHPERRILVVLMLATACGGSQAGATGTATETGPDTDSGPGTDSGPDMEQCAPIGGPVRDGLGVQRLERLATRAQIPGLAEQATAHGQILGTLFAFDGRVHLGYGDYSANTGPIAMSAWDPALGGFADMGTLPTEEVLWLRAGDGALYAPAIDPDGHEESGGVYRLDCGATQWYVAPPIDGAVHVYDVAARGDTIYTSTGSLTGAPALLLSSRDHGESWTELLRRESAPERFSRIYFVGATPSLLFASGRDHPDPSESFAWLGRSNGELESLLEPPEGSLVPIVLGEALVVVAFSGSPGRGTHLGSYRIEDRAFVPDEPWPVVGDGATLVAWAPQPVDDEQPERLLVLMGASDGSTSVHRTADLARDPTGESVQWEPLAQLDALADDAYVSMALLRGDLYLGTRGGALHVLRELEAPPG